MKLTGRRVGKKQLRIRQRDAAQDAERSRYWRSLHIKHNKSRLTLCWISSVSSFDILHYLIQSR